jgi:NADPH:quinone reductase-like Zn-dependent oxidoreductase
VGAAPGDVVIVSAAAGGVGSIAVQLLVHAGATVIGLAGPDNHAWLSAHGVTPVAYGDGVADRVRAVTGGRADAFIDTWGSGYVDLALELGIAPGRIDTIVDWDRARAIGAKTEGNAAGGRADVLAELAGLIAAGELDVPIAAVYPLDRVRDAYRAVERQHTRGKIVLVP